MRDLNSGSDLNALKVPELKEELEARGIMDKKLKLKKDLIEALHEVSMVSEKQNHSLTIKCLFAMIIFRHVIHWTCT
jgi:hypothetical protein